MNDRVIQTIHFIDNPVIGSSNFCEKGTNTPTVCSVSKTYPYTVKKSLDGGTTWSEVLFYGNKFIEQGATSISMDITDFIRFNVKVPSWDELMESDTFTFHPTEVISLVRWDVYDGTIDPQNRVGGNTTSVASIYRYPNYHTYMDLMIGDPFITQVDLNIICPLLQGTMRENINPGSIPAPHYTGQSFRLTPRFPFIPMATNSVDKELRVWVGVQNNYNLTGLQVVGKLSGTVTVTNNLTYTPTSVPHTGYYSLYFDDLYTFDSLYFNNGGSYFDKICDVDISPCSKYYLMWQDRYGGYQSQPFSMGHTYKETFSTVEIKNYRNERKVIQSDIQPLWVINSGWIDEELYPFYESIFMSKILVLTDTEEGKRIEVRIKETEYTEKTFKNQNRKMFNLKLTCERASKQQITY